MSKPIEGEESAEARKRRLYIEARARANTYLQPYPGEGFNHSAETFPPAFTGSDVQLVDLMIDCKCNQRFWVPRKPREHGEVQIALCPGCFYWHAITWFNSRTTREIADLMDADSLFPPAK